MKFMIIVKSCEEFETATLPLDPDPALFAAMGEYNEQLAKAGVLLDASGLKPSRMGWRIEYEPTSSGDRRTVIDGPFAEAKELIAGYTMIDVRSREEAMEWSRRFPNPAGVGKHAVIEVRPFYELDDFAPSPTLERMRALENREPKK